MNKLLDLYKAKEQNKLDIKQRKKILHKQFRETHNKFWVAMDIMIVVIVLFNFGALALTNVMVMRNNPDTVLMEANPIAAEQMDIQQLPKEDMVRTLTFFLTRVFFWCCIIGLYIYQRSSIYTEEQLNYMLFILSILFFMLGLDFFNDFGFWIGKLMGGF